MCISSIRVREYDIKDFLINVLSADHLLTVYVHSGIYRQRYTDRGVERKDSKEHDETL